MLTRLAVLLTSATISASIVPAAASQCASPSAIAATRTHWAAIRSQFSNAADRQAACRAYAASFYESVVTRHAATSCTGNSEIAALDSEIDTFNDLLATKCGS